MILGAFKTDVGKLAPKILLIDDSEEIQPIVGALLNSQGYELLFATDGLSGIKAAKEHQPDLILLDMALPDIDGMEVCELLQIQLETSLIPVIFLTARTEKLDCISGLNQGASDYVCKPFLPDELIARVRAVMRHRTLLNRDHRNAFRDGLTGLWNRSYLDDRLTAEVAEAMRYNRPFACIMADIDHFKSINDRYGHGVGDTAIKTVAATMSASCRSEDVVCRYGGEEFVILCPSSSVEGALALAERIRIAVSQEVISTHAGPLQLTASFGVAGDGLIGESLLGAADSALYAAKASGRNRCCIASAEVAMSDCVGLALT